MLLKEVRKIDSYCSEHYVDEFRKRTPHIIVICLHKTIPNQIKKHKTGPPELSVTINELEGIIKYFKKRNYIFINDRDLLNIKNDFENNYIMLTFDDGYYNNTFALSLLEKYNAKATLYISTDFITQKKNYWWEIVFKKYLKGAISEEEKNKVFAFMLTLKAEDQEDYLIKNYGEQCLYNHDDINRPMTLDEIKNITRLDYTSLGNHTTHHQILPLYTKEEIASCLTNANKILEEASQDEILSIAYPHGRFDDKTLKYCSKFFKLGFTIIDGKLNFPWEEQMNLNRYIIYGNRPILHQCRRIHTDFSILRNISKLIR